jgi:hypothetical protein
VDPFSLLGDGPSIELHDVAELSNLFFCRRTVDAEKNFLFSKEDFLRSGIGEESTLDSTGEPGIIVQGFSSQCRRGNPVSRRTSVGPGVSLSTRRGDQQKQYLPDEINTSVSCQRLLQDDNDSYV